MTVVRTISRSVAAVVEQLELDGGLLVTAERLGDVLREVGGRPGDARRVAYELERAGWLGRLRTRHAWEFIPGSRGGVYGSGDRFIEFRAQLAVNPVVVGRSCHGIGSVCPRPRAAHPGTRGRRDRAG